MKRFTVLAFFVMVALSSFAYYGDYSYSSPKFEMPGWLIFMGIIMFVWGVLEIILFFKIWGMTDDIREMKTNYFNEKKRTRKSMRKNFLLGDIEKVKTTLLKQFVDDVEAAFAKMKSSGYEDDENGTYHLVSYNEKNLKESIRPYIEKLQKQFEFIGEEMPIYFTRMETFNDYFSIFAEEDNVETTVKTNTPNIASAERNDNGQEKNRKQKQLGNRRKTYISSLYQ